MANVISTVLVVDDLSEMLRAFQRHFAGRGEVVTVSSPDEAIAVLEAAEVAAILTDYQMPGRDGVDLLEEVQRGGPRTRGFLMSGAVVPGIAELMAGGLVEKFFATPMDVAVLFAVLTTAR
ncbi:MAG TPA: response regulator [Polyangiaceae bacterium]